jgi:hypothetical protein
VNVGLGHGWKELEGAEAQSALRELGSLTGFLEAVLPAFLGAGIAAEVSLGFEGFAVIAGELTEGAGSTLLDGVGLAGETTTAHIYQ